jgi:serine palmitoyltransferase
MLSRGVACVSVGYPATPLTKWRVRFCITAAHTRKMLDYVLNEMETFAKQIGI